jgi:rubrerythrin
MNDTQNNLRSAFAGESQANRRYVFFAEVAQREGYHNITSLFRRTADEETEHARALFNMLYPQITTKDALKMALEGETLETKMYPEYAAIAEKEGETSDAAELRRLLNEAKEHFEKFAKAEKEHAEAYRKELENLFPGV